MSQDWIGLVFDDVQNFMTFLEDRIIHRMGTNALFCSTIDIFCKLVLQLFASRQPSAE
jgi:hypothetical protein